MKSTYRRLIKILSCSLTIAAVVLCSVCVPAKAAVTWTVLNPADYITSVSYNGNFRKVYFNFGTKPFLREELAGYTGYSSLEVPPRPSGVVDCTFGIYPLGVYATGGPPLSHGKLAIDISDFKSNAALEVISSLSFSLDILQLGSSAQNLRETLELLCTWSFIGYGSNGSYIGSWTSTKLEDTIILIDTYDDYNFDFDRTLRLALYEFPDNVQYIIPACRVVIDPVNDEPDLVVESIRLTSNYFTFETSTDMLLQESLTLQAIEDQMGELNDQVGDLNDEMGELNDQVGDLNDEMGELNDQVGDLKDKADTIISGSDDLQDSAENALFGSQDLEERLDQAIDELEDLEDISDQFVDGKYKDFSAVANDLKAWLATRSWNDFISLVQPIMEFPAMVTILSMLVAFINISILFFGR